MQASNAYGSWQPRRAATAVTTHELLVSDTRYGAQLFSPVADLDDGETVKILRAWDIDGYDYVNRAETNQRPQLVVASKSLADPDVVPLAGMAVERNL